ncbi:hypothetical protein T492DRAFT_527490 [Pavlovales sp. CCMP2436]|nr:hypothetical protein T492DRAFT_527490 [Pavlovales sp. CCMP2436]
MCLDASRVYATGISRGGRFASRLASEMSDIIAAVGIVSGIRYPTPNNATRPVPIIAFHGTADPINPVSSACPFCPFFGVGLLMSPYLQPEGVRAWHGRVSASVVSCAYFKPRVVSLPRTLLVEKRGACVDG